MLGLSTSQISAVLERLVYVGVPLLTAHGVTTKDDEQFVIAGILAVIGAVVGIWNNRAKRLAQRAAIANPGAVIVGSPELARSTRANNVVSTSDVIITPR